ncbi:family 10 glycosylhydrolase [Flavobacterium sp.]|uniref:family 10 glycosylhydrolase n=1 Tax=Flavobacterium sp. TaxID=239 RepID=UPI0037520A17
MRKIIILIFTLLIFQISVGQCIQNIEFNDAIPKRDVRGVFLTSVYNLDWPTSRTASPSVQQAELIVILDNLKNNGYNTVFIQVRPECDALYNSTLEPWSYRLTGTQGLAPNPLWDPLSFATTQAHNRGLDLHAWINPYRVRASIAEYTAATNSILDTQPTWILTASNNTNLKILNPGLPAVQDYITSIVQDISNRYDIDGIHFDDYFYPNGGMTTNQDNQTFVDNNPTNIATIEDWRRNNVNIMIGKVYDAIQIINNNQNKNIIFGVSPFGIWKSETPTGIVGNSSFSALFCDPIAWLNAGKVDYLAPQLYWKITGGQDYIALSKWWNDQVKAYNKQLYVGQGYYKMTDTNNWAGTEIQNQIIQNRAANMDATFGQIAYRYLQIKNNDKTVKTILNGAQYQYKSFAPPIAGKDNICPNIPVNIRFEGLNIKWDTPTIAPDGDSPAKYVIYAFDSANQAITNQEDGSKIIDIVAGNQLSITQNQIDTKHFVVSSLDKNNNENGNFGQTLDLTNKYFDGNVKLSIYPNPFFEQFTIENNTEYYGRVSVSLYDLSGKLVWFQTNNSNRDSLRMTINPINLKKGFYLGKISFDNGVRETFKLVKE